MLLLDICDAPSSVDVTTPTTGTGATYRAGTRSRQGVRASVSARLAHIWPATEKPPTNRGLICGNAGSLDWTRTSLCLLSPHAADLRERASDLRDLYWNRTSQ